MKIRRRKINQSSETDDEVHQQQTQARQVERKDRQRDPTSLSSSTLYDSNGSAVSQDSESEVLLVQANSSVERKDSKSLKQAQYSSSFLEHQRSLEESQRNLTVDHLLQSSLDLDDVARKKIEQVRAQGSKKFARELIELLESASKCVEQNANLLNVLRHHLGLGAPSQHPVEDKKDSETDSSEDYLPSSSS